MVDPDALEVPDQLVPNFLPIIKWPDDRLHIDCQPITTFDDWLKQFSLDLFATMKNADGVGLAAPQVGVAACVCAIWIDESRPIVLVNPEIVEYGKDMYQVDEGCLSVPGYFEKRKRPQSVKVRYRNVRGEQQETEFHGLHAFVVQHEIDHLRGKVFVDGVSNLKKGIIRKKMKKFLKRR